MSKNINLTFEAEAIQGNKGYSSDYDRNALYRIDTDTGKCHFIMSFPLENILQKRLHCDAARIGNKVYFIPYSGSYISVYDIIAGQVYTLDVPRPDTAKYPFYKRGGKFCCGIHRDEYLWLIPATYPGIIRLRLSDDHIDIIDDWVEAGEYFFKGIPYIADDTLLLTSINNNVVLEFNLSKAFATAYRIGQNNNGMAGVCRYNDDYIFAPWRRGSVIRWDRRNGRIYEYDDFPDGFNPADQMFANIYEIDDRLVLVPAKANTGLIYEADGLYIDSDIKWKTDPSGNVQYLYETEEYRYYREAKSVFNCRYYRIDRKENELNEFRFSIDNEDEMKQSLISQATTKKELFSENANFRFNDFLDVCYGSSV